MINPFKNKKGVSLVELMAAIVIIGIGSTTLTSMIITTYRRQIRATDYLLGKEVANTYVAIFCRDVQRANLAAYVEANPTALPQGTYVTLTQEMISTLTKVGDNESQTYNYLYSTNSLTLNGNDFNSSTVAIEFQLISPQVGFRTRVTVKYDGEKAVTNNGVQFFI